ncbi:type II toxin-antitoxin system VapC family toxin [Roseofilum sp. BLCC_M91]|uniref:Type II toxin-antitoxin system VapC family toxin n=1 Tax=Roseofilum halophilum BLCC-M91 TaxID=3022259 RepID=A0ABT7BFZ6_9CYAN|nr:type II toxin-antitoxin system VapC family toxin [Roseofilum halophilum]MDJ1177514.1 type II toxin-antitoxin system VapC family toxin [Roseofilum halophilum BLCC-M91]
MIILDTHILVWWIQNDPQLNSYHRECIEQQRSNGLGVCTISLIEIARLVSAGRIILPIPIAQWFEIALGQECVMLISITPAIAIEAQTLPGDFHKDPADRIIVATARLSDASIVTVDRKILNYPYVQAIPPTTP